MQHYFTQSEPREAVRLLKGDLIFKIFRSNRICVHKFIYLYIIQTSRQRGVNVNVQMRAYSIFCKYRYIVLIVTALWQVKFLRLKKMFIEHKETVEAVCFYLWKTMGIVQKFFFLFVYTFKRRKKKKQGTKRFDLSLCPIFVRFSSSFFLFFFFFQCFLPQTIYFICKNLSIS